jgi:hypothetical protein
VGIDWHIEHSGSAIPLLVGSLGINSIRGQDFVVAALVETRRLLVGYRDPIDPFHRPSSQCPRYDSSGWITMLLGKGVVVHLYRKAPKSA